MQLSNKLWLFIIAIAPPFLALFSVKINCCIVRNGVSTADIAPPNVIHEFANIQSFFGVGFKMCCYRGQTATNKELVYCVDVMNKSINFSRISVPKVFYTSYLRQ